MGQILSKDVSPEALKARLERNVWSQADALIDRFQSLISGSFEPCVETLTIAANTPVEWDAGAAEYWRHLDGKDKLITTKKSGNFAGDSQPIGFALVTLPCFDAAGPFYDHGYPDVLGDVISNFTYDCWLKAGGWFFEIPTVLFTHADWGYGKAVALTKASAS